MKTLRVVIQNGAQHCLTRSVVESRLRAVPDIWAKHVERVTIRETVAPEPVVSFHPKEKSVAINGPESEIQLVRFIEALLVALSIIAEKGELPDKVGTGLWKEHRAKVMDQTQLV